MRRVELYSRPGCCLCDDARVALERIAQRIPIQLSEHDIEADDALLARYLERIPVIAIDGREAFELVIDAGDLEAALAGADF